MTTIADFLVMQLLVLVTLLGVYMVRDRLAAARDRQQTVDSHTAETTRPRVRAISSTAAASA